MATIPSVANFSAGPFEGHMQNVSFNVSTNNLLLFSGTDFPRVNVDGMIDFGIATSSSGNATMDIIMVDSGGGRSQDVVNISVNGIDPQPDFCRKSNRRIGVHGHHPYG